MPPKNSLIKLTILSVCIFLQTTCAAQTKQPRNLDEAVLYFQARWTVSKLKSFSAAPESNALADSHYNTGRWIRNSWIYGAGNTELVDYFNGLGVFHPDDISSIILTSLHRTLNKKPVELEKQVAAHKAYWKPITECNARQRALAVSHYKKFKQDDKVTIFMAVDTTNGTRNAIVYDCPSDDWSFDKRKDLIIQGRVEKKYFISDTTNVFFTIHVTYLNRKDTPVLMQPVKVGSSVDLSLVGLRMK